LANIYKPKLVCCLVLSLAQLLCHFLPENIAPVLGWRQHAATMLKTTKIEFNKITQPWYGIILFANSKEHATTKLNSIISIDGFTERRNKQGYQLPTGPLKHQYFIQRNHMSDGINKVNNCMQQQ